MKNQNYFALDLELNNKNDGTQPRIIEVGLAIGSPLEPEKIHTFNWYLNPEQPIAEAITRLTGIDDTLIALHSVSHDDVAKELGEALTRFSCFVNPITWGQGDASELRNEFQARSIPFPHFGRRIFDVKTLQCFDQIVKGKNPAGGLKNAMASHKLPFMGTPHRAKDDALNTLRFFFFFLNKEARRQSLLASLADTTR